MNAGPVRSLSIQLVFLPAQRAPERRTASPWDGKQRPGNSGPPAEPRRDIMHPMFVKLFLEPDADDLLADEEEKRRRAARARHTRSRMTLRVTARPQDRRPPR
jgi:hypothetical protein